MKDFARLQAEFQCAVLEEDGSVLSSLLDGSREKREVLLGVYQHAYGARLTESLGKSFECLYRYMGHETFAEMASAYVGKVPSVTRNIRWYGGALPAFLAQEEPYADYPILTELAALESALNDAFDASDGPILGLPELAAVAPEAWHDLTFVPHPSVRRLTCRTNVLAIWSALRDDEEVPPAISLDESQTLLVWREDATAMVRSLGAEEAMMWTETAAGHTFGQICIMLATFADPAEAPTRAAGYLGQWVQAGLLAEAL